jgi:hypothetical protein
VILQTCQALQHASLTLDSFPLPAALPFLNQLTYILQNSVPKEKEEQKEEEEKRDKDSIQKSSHLRQGISCDPPC